MSINDIKFIVKEKRRVESFVQSGELIKARRTAENLCRKQRNDAECWFLLGAVSGQQGDFSRAIECCKQTVKLAPNVAVAHLNLGIALHSAGKLSEAIQPLSKSLELQPDSVVAYRELGIIYSELNDFSRAITTFNALVVLQPNDQTIWLMLGNLYEKLQDHENAERCYRKSFVIDSSSIPAGVNLGNTLKLLARFDEAESIYQQLLKIDANNLDVLFNLAVLNQSLNRYEVAGVYYQKIIEMQPAHQAALLNLGTVYMSQFQYDEAISVMSLILEKTPDNIDARRNMAAAYKELAQLEEAKQQLQIILDKYPDDVKTRQDLSLVLLQLGEFLSGWQEYEWRNHAVEEVTSRWPFSKWENNDSVKQTVLVYPEQGVGDEIMFSSCINDICEKATVVLACDKRLQPLFQRSFPQAQVIGRDKDDGKEWLSLLPAIDSQISIASLPLHFRNRLSQFPLYDHYLEVNKDSLKKWCDRYKDLEGDITVGVSWRGGHESNTKLKRSNDLLQWGSVFSLTNINFVNLQYGNCDADIKRVKEKFNVTLHDWHDSDPLIDLDDFSAKIKALDLVLSIDNSTVHIAGAVGTPAWVLQPFSPDWRWLHKINTSSWYKSVKHYRQVMIADWAETFSTVTKDLSTFKNSFKR